MDIARFTMRWTGFMGAPGYTNLYFAAGGGFVSDRQQVYDRIRDGMTSLNSILPETVSILLEEEVAILDSDSGMVSRYETVDGQGPLNGISSGPYSAASGAVINWQTDDVRFGRRIRGRTFVVPLTGSAFEDDGTLSQTTIGRLNDFADELTAGDVDSEMGVWSRPRGGSGGVFATVTGYRVPDLAAVLRSRRD